MLNVLLVSTSLYNSELMDLFVLHCDRNAGLMSDDNNVHNNYFSCFPRMFGPCFFVFLGEGDYSKGVNIYFYGLLSSPEENEVVLLECPMAAGIVW